MKEPLIIWIFQTGEPLQIDRDNPRPMRAINLSNYLANSGHYVVLWSTDFHHQKKKHRYNSNKKIKVSENLEIRLLHSLGYKRNISIKRIIDHIHLGISLKRELNKENNAPDVAFIGYPPIETAAILTAWLKKNSVPTLLDIKDQWPSLFIDQLPQYTKSVGKILFWPYFFLARKAISESTSISSMSDGFIDWVKGFNIDDNTKDYHVFPLTSPNFKISDAQKNDAQKWWDNLNLLEENSIKICFIGSISQAFNFEPIKKAALIALQRDLNIQFIICGDGNDANKIKKSFISLTNVIFPGWINRPQIEVLAQRCLASLAPYKNTNNFQANIPNKIIDSLALKLPVISPLEGEVKKLINQHKIGYIYGEDSEEELLEIILRLNSNKLLQKDLSINAYNLYINKFAFDMVYKNIQDCLEKLTDQK